MSSVTHRLCLRSGYDIAIDNTLHHETKQHWRKHVKNTLNRYISFSFKAIFATGRVENITFSIHRQPETKVTEWFEANLRQPYLPISLSIGNNCRQSTERHTALPQKIHIQLSINPSVVEAGISKKIQVSTNAADAMTPSVDRSSAVKAFTNSNSRVFVFPQEGFNYPCHLNAVKW